MSARGRAADAWSCRRSTGCSPESQPVTDAGAVAYIFSGSDTRGTFSSCSSCYDAKKLEAASWLVHRRRARHERAAFPRKVPRKMGQPFLIFLLLCVSLFLLGRS